MYPSTSVSFNTNRDIFILTKIKLSIYGGISEFRKAAEELGNKLCCQAFLLGAALYTIQDHLVSIFVLQNKKKELFSNDYSFSPEFIAGYILRFN